MLQFFSLHWLVCDDNLDALPLIVNHWQFHFTKICAECNFSQQTCLLLSSNCYSSSNNILLIMLVMVLHIMSHVFIPLGAHTMSVEFRVKFYVSDLGTLHEEVTRYQFYSQVKKDLYSTRYAYILTYLGILDYYNACSYICSYVVCTCIISDKHWFVLRYC